MTARATALLSRLPDTSPRLDAELLMTQASGLRRTELIAWPERLLGPQALAAFESLLARRLAGEPMAYLRGHQAFWDLDLDVTPDTLIPRPETELLVEIALELPDPGRPRLAADLGTGSGAVAAALGRARPAWTIVALERSAPALTVAQANFSRLGLGNCLGLRADWLDALGQLILDLILANPPYVQDGDPHLAQGDLRFEPRAALAAGPDGLDAIRRIVGDAKRCLTPGGLVAIEHGYDQAAAVRGLLTESGLSAVETRRDLAGLERVSLGCA